MASPRRGRGIASLRRLLLWWIIGSGLLLVLIYTVLLEYYLDLGISLRTKSALERDAASYAEKYAHVLHAPLPEGPGLRSYRHVQDLPVALRSLFPPDTYAHRRMQQFLNIDGELGEEHPVSQLAELCSGTPCELVFFYSYQLNETDWLYMSQGLVVTEKEDQEHDLTEDIAIYIALTILLAFSGLAFSLMRKVDKPVQRLADWVEGLTPGELGESAPDFQFQELNLVAGRLRSAFARVSQGIEKEHRFLRHASHELRTPIAVMSGNLDLLDRLAAQGRRSDAENQAFARLKHAVLDMRQLTETLLWLNRAAETPPAYEKVDLASLVNALIEDNSYLLEYKDVDVEVGVVGERGKLDAPPALCRIVLANLIRNAFQYTCGGNVVVTIAGAHVTIDNRNAGAPPQKLPEQDSDYGFGLGLGLVEQIAQQLGWQYRCEVRGDGCSTTICFQASRLEGTE